MAVLIINNIVTEGPGTIENFLRKEETPFVIVELGSGEIPADLLKPEYKNTVVYLDPRSTGVGQVMSFAANFAAGGDMNNVKPGLEYLGKLHQAGSVLRVLGTTPYAQFVKGEIPIWISYENDGLKAKITDGLGDAVAVVIPKEASAAAPYGISLVEKGPNPNAGKLWLNFIMSDFGQGIFAEGFVRPSVPGITLPASVADKLPLARQVEPVRGDVVVFQFPKDHTKDYIKRVIGIPGDRSWITNKKVYVNGIPYENPHEVHKDTARIPAIVSPRDNTGPITVPADSYFVMGDNRDSSLDSRFWGFVKREEIKGLAFLKYWSWDGEKNWVRWSEIGKLIE